jgi:hypothetical protein
MEPFILTLESLRLTLEPGSIWSLEGSPWSLEGLPLSHGGLPYQCGCLLQSHSPVNAHLLALGALLGILEAHSKVMEGQHGA